MDDNTSNSDDDENADAVNGEEGSDQTVTRTVQWRGQWQKQGQQRGEEDNITVLRRMTGVILMSFLQSPEERQGKLAKK